MMMKRIAYYGACGIGFVAASALIALILVEFMAGCGEVTYTSASTYVVNECVFLPTRGQ